MASKNKFFSRFCLLFIFSFVLSNKSYPKIVLPELLTKQATNNILFLSNDGKFTYYQNRSGSLIFSTNYKIQEVLKSTIGTKYTLFATPSRKKIVVLKNSTFFNSYSLRAKETIYLLDYGGNIPREIAEGISPTLLLNDAWLSYYDPYSKTLSFEHTENGALKFSLKLKNKINPYFIPQVVMADENTVYYTDLNEFGFLGLIEYKRSDSKSEIIYKSEGPMLKFEICLHDNYFIFSQFGIHFSKLGSSLFKIHFPFKDFSKKENIYQSDINDLGHLVCNFDKENLYFIKNFGTPNSPIFDAASLNLNSKNLVQLSENKTVNNLINMDGSLINLEKGKYYIIKGDADFKSTDSLKQKAPLAPPKKIEPEEYTKLESQ